MKDLNLPKYPFKISKEDNKLLIYDEYRKKKIVLTPEEWVRQHFLKFIELEKGYPKSIIAVEKEVKVNNLKKRFDILIFDSNGKPNLIVECKSPKTKIDQSTFDQIARYNLTLKANFLVLTNGINHYCCCLDHKNEQYHFLDEIPKYK